MEADDPIPIWYWRKLKRIDNFGDYLGRYVVERLSGKPVVYVPLESGRPVNITAGSVLDHRLHSQCVVWGSGTLSPTATLPRGLRICAVRGPLTRQRLMAAGYDAPSAIGDPALLVPYLYRPTVLRKTHRIGIVPHYVDLEDVRTRLSGADQDAVAVFDVFTADIEGFIERMLGCELIVSSSLHGIIVAQAYGIPALWVQFSSEAAGLNAFKFHDYFHSVSLPPYVPPDLRSGPIEPQRLHELHAEWRHVTSIVNFDPLPLVAACPFLARARVDALVRLIVSRRFGTPADSPTRPPTQHADA